MSVEQLVQAELARAVAKFPTWPTDPLHALAVLGEAVDEAVAALKQPAKRERREPATNGVLG